MKDKEWLKNEVKSLFDEAYDSGKMKYYESEESIHRINSLVEQIVDQIDEPQKPIIPQFVADYIEKWKHEGLSLSEWLAFDHDNNDENKTEKWLYHNDDETKRHREFTFIDAIRYGYEVEGENVYYVLDKEDVTLLKKSVTGEGVDKSVGVNINNVKSWKDKKEYQLTEQEIIDYDKRYIPFMVPVDEMNNDCTWAFAEEVKE